MRTIPVAVLGSTGMLGHAMAEVLEADGRFEVKRYCRNPGNGEHLALAHHPRSIGGLDEVEYVINCIGLIKQLGGVQRHEWFRINTLFPLQLAGRCARDDARLIHVSTDCVFSGDRGSYTELDDHDAADDYGLSKSLGEPLEQAMVLRTSVLGPERRGKLSLLEWALSQRGRRVIGFNNHRWNGLTTYGLADACRRIMLQELWEPGAHHVFSDAVTKHELLCMIDRAYSLDLTIERLDVGRPCDRVLATVGGLNAALEIPSLADMVDSMAKRSKR